MNNSLLIVALVACLFTVGLVFGKNDKGIGHFIVEIDDGLPDDAGDEIKNDESCRGNKCETRKLDIDDMKVFEVKGPKSLKNKNRKDFYVEEVQEFKATGFSCKTQSNAPWGLERISKRDLDIQGYYNYSENIGTDVDIYIIDSGIRASHDEFKGQDGVTRIQQGRNYADDSPDDYFGHGTALAGIALGRFFGVAKNANGIAVKVLAADGIGSTISVVSGIGWAIRNHREKQRNNPNVQKSIIKISVGCSDINDTLCRFTNYGSCVTILAPGLDIPSASNVADDHSSFWDGMYVKFLGEE
ncbi:aqualysin-1-like [Tubulanus polymorphus]|uniref:aqualysin-1-like n=1 Tax=Tubulanus polymorphus TaxID=672921 RepID=UPI003DA6CE2A